MDEGGKKCGKEYTDNWKTPTIMKNREKEIEKWKTENKMEKVKETTSKIPEKISDLSLLLEELKKQETEAQIQVNPY